jgi:UDP-N-acetylmuramoyl-tripeptide--D-alanyl-D-alanine ligase
LKGVLYFYCKTRILELTELYQIYLQHPSVQTDTRKLKPGDIYFALKGPNFNGNAFASDAITSGASYAVVDEKEYATNDNCILVNDVLITLQQLALHHRTQLKIPFIAITGSNGKTTTKELVTAVLRKKFNTYATEGNLNNHIGVPLTLLKIKDDARMAIIEMGANHLKEIASYCEIALPTHGIITNCGKAHIEGFGSEEGVRKGKGELYDFLRAHNGTVFRNADLSYLADMAKGIAEQVTYGSKNADYTGKAVMHDVLLGLEVEKNGEKITINSNLVGEYNFPNVMTAIAVGLHFGVDIQDVKTAIEDYLPDNSRSQLIKKGSNSIILDAYNANPSSMKVAIVNFANTALQHKMLWIGAMKEMGQDEEKEHRQLVELIRAYDWADVILVGKEFAAVKDDYRWFVNSAEAAAYIKANPPSNAAILIKGSRGSKMELMLEAF